MAQLGRLIIINSLPATQFIAASVQNAGDAASLPAGDLGDTGRGRVLRVTLRAAESKAYDVHFYATSAFNAATVALNEFLGKVSFLVADGTQVAGAGPFLYSTACDIPVRDEARAGRIYAVVVNRSAVALVGGANSLSLELAVDPTAGF